MTALIYAITIFSGLFLIGVVLLQAGKGADMGATFGGASSTVFGPSGPGNVMTKITAVTAVLWMGGSLALAVLSARDQSVFDGMEEPAPLTAPAPAEPLATPGFDSPLDSASEAARAAVDGAGAAAAGAVDAVSDAAGEAVEAGKQAASDTAAAAADSAKAAAAKVGEKADEAAAGAAGAVNDSMKAAADAAKAAGAETAPQ